MYLCVMSVVVWGVMHCQINQSIVRLHLLDDTLPTRLPTPDPTTEFNCYYCVRYLPTCVSGGVLYYILVGHECAG